MPIPWVRATIAARLNQCVRGHSAISREVVEAVVQLLRKQILPITPLRGSISASGDLLPLSYLAGVVEGSPDVYVNVGPSQRVMSAPSALAEAGLTPVALGPREALGLVNGTAASVATASLAMYDASQLLLLATSITCMVSEGLAARAGWLDPFVNEIQPHPGQAEVSNIMRAFLRGSSLVSEIGGVGSSLSARPKRSLAQDRYALRTSPQWLGPQFEDLALAYSQISTELNSTTDNPVTDSRTRSLYQVGNFQAASVTTAVEKIRSSLQMVGKMLFSQFTEMVNHTMSCGLPSNLAADDPSVSFCLKGLDINMAAYQAELGFLSNPVSSHVQSAEMHNQAINSLAFLSTRYTMQAVDVLSLMVASALYGVCQAIDLRVMHATFLQQISHIVAMSTSKNTTHAWNSHLRGIVREEAIEAMKDAWWNAASQDASQRCDTAATAFTHVLSDSYPGPSKMAPDESSTGVTLLDMRQLREELGADLLSAYKVHRDGFFRHPDTAKYLGVGTRLLYDYIRGPLGVPMHHGLVDHPTGPTMKSHANGTGVNGTHVNGTHVNGTHVNGTHSIGTHVNRTHVNGTANGSTHDPAINGITNGSVNGTHVEKNTIGSHVATIYEAIRDGRLFERNIIIALDLGLLDKQPMKA